MWRSIAIGVLLLGGPACSSLQSIVEPELSDLQLTVDTLKASLSDAQRTVADLRVEVETRRQEFADAQIARAQLEGRIREAERRLAESRHVIDLQREELVVSRAERERVGRTGAVLQKQRKQPQKYSSKMGNGEMGEIPMAAKAFPSDGQLEVATVSLDQEALEGAFEESTRIIPQPAVHASGGSPSIGGVPGIARPSIMTPHFTVLIKPGDTLWSLARRYHTSVERLMAINALPSDHIQAGQVLWLTESSTVESEHERM